MLKKLKSIFQKKKKSQVESAEDLLKRLERNAQIEIGLF